MLNNKRKYKNLVNKIILAFKNQRKQNNISTYKISKETGISDSSILNIEALKQNPTLSTMMELSISAGFDLPEALKKVYPYNGIEKLQLDNPDYPPLLEVIINKLQKADDKTLQMINDQINILLKYKK